MTISARDVHLRRMENPEYAKAFAAAQERLELACQMTEARARAGLSQEELAQAMETSQTQVSRWERGKAAPTGDSLRRFAIITKSRVFIVPDEAAAQVERLIHKRPARGAAARTRRPERAKAADAPAPKRRAPQLAVVATS